jgi:NADH-quinone oxidoreductase subunit B
MTHGPLDQADRSGFVTARLAQVVNELQVRSLWPAGMGLACCAIEFMMGGAPDYDFSRFGMEVYRATPRQADLMVVSGRLSQKMAPVLRTCYDQMAEPRWVIAMGACASSGGMFNNYAIVQGIDHVVPVDVYLPGCPPRPEMLIDSYLKLHELIRRSAPFSADRDRIRREVEAAALAAVPLADLPLAARLAAHRDLVA